MVVNAKATGSSQPDNRFGSRAEQEARYERLKSGLSQHNGSAQTDDHFVRAALEVLLSSELVKLRPDDTAGIFTKDEARRAIYRIGRLHQEYQWLTYRTDPKKAAWLWTWRAVKHLWLEGMGTFASDKEAAFFRTGWVALTLNGLDDTNEILQWSMVQKIVFEFADCAFVSLSPAQSDEIVEKKAMLEGDEQLLRNLIHGDQELDFEVYEALRRTAALYRVLDGRDPSMVKQDNRTARKAAGYDPAEESSTAKSYPMKTFTSMRSAWDYAYYPFPETRALACAADQLIKRDMREPGIQSDGLRASDLHNIPRAHVQPKASLILGKKIHERPVPRQVPSIAPRKLQRKPALSTGRDSASKLSASSRSPLSPKFDEKSRVSKPSSRPQLPTTKLRGGGYGPEHWMNAKQYWPKEKLDAIQDLADLLRLPIWEQRQADYLVGDLLVKANWDVDEAFELWEDKGEGISTNTIRAPIVDLSFSTGYGSEEKDQLLRLAAFVDSSAYEDDDEFEQVLLRALERNAWRWEDALSDFYGRSDAAAADDLPLEDTGLETQLFLAGAEDDDQHGSPAQDSNQENQQPRRSPRQSPVDAENQQQDPPSLSHSNQENEPPVDVPVRRQTQPDRRALRSISPPPENIIDLTKEDNNDPFFSGADTILLSPKNRSNWRAEDQGSPTLALSSNPNRHVMGPAVLPGLEDHVSVLEDNPNSRESSSGQGMADPLPAESEHPGQESVEAYAGHCHRCPYFPGEFHHVCNGLCSSLDLIAVDGLCEHIQDLPPVTTEDDGLAEILMQGCDSIAEQVKLRKNAGPSWTNARFHVHLRMLNDVSFRLLKHRIGTKDFPNGGMKFTEASWRERCSWSSFQYPSPMFEKLLLDIGKSVSKLLDDAEIDVDKQERKLAVLVMFMFSRFYGRSQFFGGRRGTGETMRPLGRYHQHAARLQRILRQLAGLFRECDELSGIPRNAPSHYYYHEAMTLAHDDLLLVRRGLGETITEKEWEDPPLWDQYTGHEVEANADLYAGALRAATYLDQIQEFFAKGSADDGVDTEGVQRLLAALRRAMYVPAPEEDVNEDTSADPAPAATSASPRREKSRSPSVVRRPSRHTPRGSPGGKRKSPDAVPATTDDPAANKDAQPHQASDRSQQAQKAQTALPGLSLGITKAAKETKPTLIAKLQAADKADNTEKQARFGDMLVPEKKSPTKKKGKKGKK
ncbi:uncharacterized protein AB675_772 [Cyphellophora attinorum]|uniref:Uncharacterized protein n=1 Tax=Cyphellophora attinorum TaxID=1664694 RepID=A0A0N0NSF8_9EURO|nr:uncharacterized protein AB675_772 [Phialophora attinorum]KPI45959.1 hypothetical protein AB675_772 [Phialophora attinorum]